MTRGQWAVLVAFMVGVTTWIVVVTGIWVMTDLVQSGVIGSTNNNVPTCEGPAWEPWNQPTCTP